MDIGASFSYVFQDPQWLKKVGIGGAIFLVGVLFSWLLALPLLAASMLMYGYMLVTVKNVAEGSSVPLPEWNDFGGLLKQGLFAVIGGIILFLPVIVLACCNVVLQTVVSGAANGTSSDQAGQLASVLSIVSVCIGCLEALFGLAAGIFFYAPLTRFALNGQLSTFWDFKGNWAFIQSNVGSYLIAVILAFVASFIGSLGFILCVIPGFFTAFWANLVTAHLFGQLARGQASAATMPPANSPMPTTS